HSPSVSAGSASVNARSSAPTLSITWTNVRLILPCGVLTGSDYACNVQHHTAGWEGIPPCGMDIVEQERMGQLEPGERCHRGRPDRRPGGRGRHRAAGD